MSDTVPLPPGTVTLPVQAPGFTQRGGKIAPVFGTIRIQPGQLLVDSRRPQWQMLVLQRHSQQQQPHLVLRLPVEQPQTFLFSLPGVATLQRRHDAIDVSLPDDQAGDTCR